MSRFAILWRAIRWRLLGLAILAAGCFAVWWVLSGNGLADELAAAHNEGIPISIEELNAPQPGENAADTFATLVGKLELSRRAVRDYEIAVDEGTLTPRLQAKRVHHLKLAEADLETVKVAARVRRFQVQFGNRPLGWSGEYHLQQVLGDASTLLCNRAIYVASTDPSGAFDDLETAAHLSRQLALVPGGAALYFRRAVLLQLAAAVDRVVTVLPLTPSVARRVRTIVELAAQPVDVRNVLRCELAQTLAIFHELIDRGYAFNQPDADPSLHEYASCIGPVGNAVKIRFVRYWRRVFAELPTDRANLLAASDAAESVERSWFDNRDPYTIMSAKFFEAAGQRVDQALEVETQARLLLAFAILLEQRAGCREGVASMPLDPYSNRPLRVIETKGGFKVYSVGRDRSDDHGVTYRDSRGPTHDVVIEYPYRAPKMFPPGSPAP